MAIEAKGWDRFQADGNEAWETWELRTFTGERECKLENDEVDEATPVNRGDDYMKVGSWERIQYVNEPNYKIYDFLLHSCLCT